MISLGYLVGGLRGVALTLVAIAVPPMLVLLLVHGLYRRYGHHPAVEGFVRGLGLAVAATFVVRFISASGMFNSAPCVKITARSMRFSSSRMLPGQ